VRRRILPTIGLLLALSLVWSTPAPAQTQAELNLYQRILADYVKNGGRFSVCKFTEEELKKAKNAIPEDNEQYGAPLIAALEDAIAARAQGQCNTKKQAAAAAPPPAAAPPAGTAPPPPPAASTATSDAGPAQAQPPAAPAQAQEPPKPAAEPAPAQAIAADDSIALASRSTEVATDAPFPIVLLAIVAGLMALAALVFGVVRWFAWEPAWAVRLRHAAGEAGWRASSTFSEFTDFVRLGR
jgi:hypothetical protein